MKFNSVFSTEIKLSTLFPQIVKVISSFPDKGKPVPIIFTGIIPPGLDLFGVTEVIDKLIISSLAAELSANPASLL